MDESRPYEEKRRWKEDERSVDGEAFVQMVSKFEAKWNPTNRQNGKKQSHITLKVLRFHRQQRMAGQIQSSISP